MIRVVRALYGRFREQIHYMIFGALTTAVNMAVYYILMLIPWFRSGGYTVMLFSEEKSVGYLIANAAAFVVSVVFSYFANRNFVFGNKVSGCFAVIRQFFVFFATRFASFVVEEVLLFIAVGRLGISEYVAKWPIAVSAVLINYTLGRFVVFRAGDGIPAPDGVYAKKDRIP